jgi:hypothetical protein
LHFSGGKIQIIEREQTIALLACPPGTHYQCGKHAGGSILGLHKILGMKQSAAMRDIPSACQRQLSKLFRRRDFTAKPNIKRRKVSFCLNLF